MTEVHFKQISGQEAVEIAQSKWGSSGNILYLPTLNAFLPVHYSSLKLFQKLMGYINSQEISKDVFEEASYRLTGSDSG